MPELELKTVRAFWIVPKNKAIKEISPDFKLIFEVADDWDGVYVAVDVSEKYWFASGYSPRAYRYKVGDEINMISLDEQEPSERWNALRIALLTQQLGKPNAGQTTFYVDKTAPICKCEITTLMNFGCPSNRGKTCPSL